MTYSLTQTLPSDAAVELTLAYLTLIEKNLDISYNSQGEPICVPAQITDEQVWRLNASLRDLLTGSMAKASIDASRKYGEAHIQAIGFGHASDFDAFVKVGFLYAERVAMWDLLCSRVLASGRFDIETKDLISELACNLLLLRAAIELGGIVILPHPIMWSEKARNIASELNRDKGASTVTLGFAMAVAAIDEGLPLHPYTIALHENIPRPRHAAINSEVYYETNRKFATAATALVASKEFDFLRDVRLDDFYRITLAHPDLNRALRQLFASLVGISSQQSRKDLEQILANVKKLSTARDKSIAWYKIDGSIATVSFVVSLATTVSAPAVSLVAIAGVAASALSLMRRWLATPQKDIVVQAFSDLRAARPFSLELPTAIPELEGSTPVVDPEIDKHVQIVTDARWTEDAHLYLTTLDDDTARRVMESLSEEQIHKLVNFRHFQHHYIGDYLQYVWESSEDAFWRHIEQTFTSEEGLLMHDDPAVDEILMSVAMPLGVWATLLRFTPSIYEKVLIGGSPIDQGPVDYQVEQLAGIIAYQLLKSSDKLEKQVIFNFWLSGLDEEKRKTVNILLQQVFDSETPNWVYGRELSPLATSPSS